MGLTPERYYLLDFCCLSPIGLTCNVPDISIIKEHNEIKDIFQELTPFCDYDLKYSFIDFPHILMYNMYK